MTDIVERLRKAAEDFEQMRAHAANMVDSDCEPHWSEQQEMAEASLAAREAAAEIERLRKDLAEAVTAHNELVEELRQANKTYGDMLAEAVTERDTYKQRYEDAFADYTRLHDEKMMAKWPECEPKIQAMLAEARNNTREIAYVIDESGVTHRQFTVVYREDATNDHD